MVTTAATPWTAQAASIAPSKNSVSGGAVPAPQAAGAAKPGAEAGKTPSTGLGAAAIVVLSAAAQARLAESGGPGVSRATSLDDLVRERTKALADRISGAMAQANITTDGPITFKHDGSGAITTDGPSRKAIETLFKDDPDLAREFKDVAALHGMQAMQKVLEALQAEVKAAKDDDGRNAAYGRYTVRLVKLQDVSGTMTLEAGTLRSRSVALADAMVGGDAAGTETREAAARPASRTA
ncbi:hypothetical protein SAMN04487843_10116 [Methylobacterium sp. ap11]|uniref:hypothetical protein n=1 Tax=Methylobacterium sp. ap11 TaxID=1761799 RepID=UPI0008CD651E|nr:hypothetical protein [Methylobacterium sp. ap11]SEO33100.1 hypothetical protein SAMN04487843_10116 [Methylobacterium sp. ap11]